MNAFICETLSSDTCYSKKTFESIAICISNCKQLNYFQLVSGDDDLPVRDDIGERRRKFELQVLGKAGAAAVDDSGDEMRDQENAGADSMDEDEDGGPEESEDEFYKEVKQQRAAKISTKAVLYSRYVFPLRTLNFHKISYIAVFKVCLPFDLFNY